MNKNLLSDFNYIISFTTSRIQFYLSKLSFDYIKKIQEIRIRAERPIVILYETECCFLTTSGKLSNIYSTNCVITYSNEILEMVNKICGYSLHSHYEDLLNGYVTLKNGARIGLTGTAVFDKSKIKGIKDIDGLNIRIPRYVQNYSSVVFTNIYKDSVSNLLIAGPPSSGKTTMLKDLAYHLSSGKMNKLYKVCIIDERKEISTAKKSVSELGLNTDILYGYPKATGISIAVRCLSPDIIICDEISTEDTEEIIKAMNSGVIFIFTIHAKNYEELKNKYSYMQLYKNGCINNILIINEINNFTIISEDTIKEEVVYETDNNSLCNYSDAFHNNKLY